MDGMKQYYQFNIPEGYLYKDGLTSDQILYSL